MPAPQKLPRGACDAFSQHLQAIGRIPLLTPDEEITLARQVQRGLRLREAAQEMNLRSGGHSPSLEAWALEVRLTPQALQRQLRHAERAQARMITANLRLVVSIARRFSHGPLELEDLVQEGNLGLIRAVDRFDPSRGYRFSTYATWWIREGIGRALAQKSRSIRLPQQQLELLQKLRRTQQQLTQELGRDASLAELAAATGCKPLDIREALFRAQEPLSLDAAHGFSEERRLLDSLRCQGTAPQDRLMAAHLRRDLRQLLQQLPASEAELLRLRYGLDSETPMSLSAVARQMGITRDTARGLERRANAAIRRLSAPVQDYLEA
jgi:RNA polymerase nonessential primary-like sigma factor